MCMCSLCFNSASYTSANSDLSLCEECYYSMQDEYESSLEDQIGCSFDDYYDIQELD